jgi:aminoglycoside phosphotransferase family enzyme/predicted kinase
MRTLLEDLRSVDAYPPPHPARVEVRETHVSCVFLVGDDVYKVKKPVDFGFLDFSTTARRLAACDAELRLNRRLAPDVYVGVVPITRGLDGRHRIGEGDGVIVDHAVHMRRLSDELRADVLVERGALGVAEIDRIAITLARFHAGCTSDAETERYGTTEAIGVNVRENFAQTREALHRLVAPAEAAHVERYQLAFLRERADVFASRVARGAVRDGHGDLRLEHVYLREHDVAILDGIEFNDRFRFADVACDLAFLTMDLGFRGRVDLAEALLAAYARETNDFDLYGVIDFYESYRAYVRAKIASFLAADASLSEPMRALAEQDARRHLLLALAAGRTPIVAPTLVAVGGILAAGKSTLARWISAELAAPVAEADRTRKGMLGVAPTTRVHDGSWSGAYDRGFTDKVYAELMRRADVVLASGRPMIVDASFRSPAMRAAAREVARAHDVPFVFVECRAPADVCRARLAERERRGGAVSDGRLAIFDDFVREWQPVTELSGAEHLVVDTSADEEQTHREILTHVASWPRGADQ